MLLRIGFVAEIFATLICIHCIYGKKIRLDVRTVSTFLSILLILQIINSYRLGGVFSLIIYIVLFLYCKFEFRSSFIDTVISLVLCMILLTSIQFVCVLFVSLLRIEGEYVQHIVNNTVALFISGILFPKCNLHRFQKSLCKNSRVVMFFIGFMCLVVTIMLLQGKVFYEIKVEYYALAIPAVFMLLYLIWMWHTAQAEAERMEEEIHKAEENSKDFENLLTSVRLRQHEFKNHMAAVFSAHYTYKTYEKLVQAQSEYCEKIVTENRYNNLLLLGNNILVGYLYGKFQEAEEDGIKISYEIAAAVDKMRVPTYYVVEMLGILLDNAVEALKAPAGKWISRENDKSDRKAVIASAQKRISFEVFELEEAYRFSVMNPYPYISYDEILEWFQPEKSEKGSGRGLGLYHLKCLCEEWKCDIGCKNVEIEDNNWIAFTLKIEKTDNE